MNKIWPELEILGSIFNFSLSTIKLTISIRIYKENLVDFYKGYISLKKRKCNTNLVSLKSLKIRTIEKASKAQFLLLSLMRSRST